MLEDELNYFLSSSQRNLWIGNDRVAVYVRKSKRYVLGTCHSMLDLASIEVNRKYKRQGIFKDVFSTFLRLSPYPYVCVENVLTGCLEQWLRTQDPVYIDELCTFPSFYFSKIL